MSKVRTPASTTRPGAPSLPPAEQAHPARRASVLPAALLGLAVLALWWVLTTAAQLPPVLLPSPQSVLRRLWLGVSQAHLLSYAWVTVREALLGCLGAAALALPLAWALARWQPFSRAVLPYVAASQAVPAIALAPLLVVWIGYGTLPVVVLCVLMVFFPITVSVLLGLRGLDSDVVDAARLDGAHGWRMISYVEAPMALPSILAGLRTGFTLSVTGAVVGEMTMGGQGLGMVLSSQKQTVDTAGLFSTITLLCLMAVTIHWVLHELERRSRVVDSMRGRRAT